MDNSSTVIFNDKGREQNFKRALKALCDVVRDKVTAISRPSCRNFPFNSESVANFSRASLVSSLASVKQLNLQNTLRENGNLSLSILASKSNVLVQSGSGITDPSEPLHLINERIREHQSRSETETRNPLVMTKFECIKQSQGNQSELQIDNEDNGSVCFESHKSKSMESINTQGCLAGDYQQSTVTPIGEPVIKAGIYTNATNLLPTDIVSFARPKLDHATDGGDVRTKNVNNHTTAGANTANTSHDETSHEKKASTPKYITALQRGQRNSRVRVRVANKRHKEWHKDEIQPRRRHAHHRRTAQRAAQRAEEGQTIHRNGSDREKQALPALGKTRASKAMTKTRRRNVEQSFVNNN